MPAENEKELLELNVNILERAVNSTIHKALKCSDYIILSSVVILFGAEGLTQPNVSLPLRVVSGIVDAIGVIGLVGFSVLSLEIVEEQGDNRANLAVEQYKLDQLNKVERPEDLPFDQDNPNREQSTNPFTETT